jgi:hypothetical protein
MTSLIFNTYDPSDRPIFGSRRDSHYRAFGVSMSLTSSAA